MKILFMTSEEFSIPCMDRIIDSNHRLLAIVTRPDKPEGRGRKIKQSIIKKYALKNNIKCFTPIDLNNIEFIESIKELKPELAVVATFRILPKEVFNIPKFGTVNIHASMLPEYRGAAPINWAIIRGETETGLTIFFINEEIDKGGIVLQKKMLIGEDETFGVIYQRLSAESPELLMEFIELIQSGNIKIIPQKEGIFKKAPKIKPNHLIIDWSKSAVDVHNLIRGLSPHPGAYTTYKEKRFKIIKSKIFANNKTECNPGSVHISDLKDGLIVNTGKGMIQILEIMREGKRKMPIKNFLIGNKIEKGEIFK